MQGVAVPLGTHIPDSRGRVGRQSTGQRAGRGPGRYTRTRGQDSSAGAPRGEQEWARRLGVLLFHPRAGPCALVSEANPEKAGEACEARASICSTNRCRGAGEAGTPAGGSGPAGETGRERGAVGSGDATGPKSATLVPGAAPMAGSVTSPSPCHGPSRQSLPSRYNQGN